MSNSGITSAKAVLVKRYVIRMRIASGDLGQLRMKAVNWLLNWESCLAKEGNQPVRMPHNAKGMAVAYPEFLLASKPFTMSAQSALKRQHRP
jgi:hypothetical protein